MKTIAIMNNKGGVGKTVTDINLADILVRDYHKRVVLADCDGQMNLTRFFLPEFDPEDGGTVAEVLTGTHEPYWRANLAEIREGLDLLPGSTALYDLDLLAIRDGLRDTHALERFREAVYEDGETDYFIFDCPPGYTLSSVSALLAADQVVVPLVIDGFSIHGMTDMKAQLDSLQRAAPEIAGVLVLQWRNSEVVKAAEGSLKDAKKEAGANAAILSRAEKMIKAYADSHKTGNFACVTPAEADRILREFYGLPEPYSPLEQVRDLADFF